MRALLVTAALCAAWSSAAVAGSLSGVSLPKAPSGGAGLTAAQQSQLADAVQASGGDYSAALSKATGELNAITAAARGSAIVNVMGFGAKGDGTTDDAPAINKALAYARTLLSGTTQPYFNARGPYARLVFPTGHTFRIGTSLNVTGFGRGLVVEMTGAELECHVKGGTCIDALSSSFVTWRDLTLIGDATDMPKIGLQMGRIDTGLATQSVHVLFDNPTIGGQFITTGFYNYGGETMTVIHPTFNNYSGLTGSYAMIQDGYDHFGLTSAFQTVTATADSATSFNEDIFIDADIRANVGDGVPIWLGGTSRHMFLQSYVAGGSTTCKTCAAVVLYNESSNYNNNLYFDTHSESTGLTDVFSIQGDNSQTLSGLFLRDPNPFASNSLFKLASNITGITMRKGRVETGGFPYGGKFLDAPSLWTWIGDYYSTGGSGWTVPAIMQGDVMLGNELIRATYPGPATTGSGMSITAQVPDQAVTGGNVRGVGSVDFQQLRIQPYQIAAGPYSVLSGGIYNSAPGSYSGVFGGWGNQALAIYSMAAGFNNYSNGYASVALGAGNQANKGGSVGLGINTSDNNMAGSEAFSTSDFANAGDSEAVTLVLRGTGTGTGAIRLTSNGAAVATDNCVNLPVNFSAASHILLIATDTTTRGMDYSWYQPQALLTKDATASTMLVTQIGTATAGGRGTTTGATVSTTADTTNGCVNLSFTPPSANTTDVWHVTARFDAVVQQ